MNPEGIHVVTSFSADGWEVYGRSFVKSYLTHWTAPLTVWTDGVEQLDLPGKIVSWRRLEEDRAWATWMKRYDRPQWRGNSDPNTQMIRFAHKVFAITQPWAGEEWRIWIDADVVFTGDVADAALDILLPDAADLCYLGRKDYHYTECGFVAYHIARSAARSVLAAMRRTYTTGGILQLPANQRHDSRVFDIARESVATSDYNYSDGISGIHVWPRTILGKSMVHHKGSRKNSAYPARDRRSALRRRTRTSTQQ